MSTSLKMSETIASELNEHNKRPAPSQARLDKLKQLKSNKKNEISSVSLQNDGGEVFPKETLVRGTAPVLTAMETEVSLWKKRNGNMMPKMHLKGDARKKKIVFGLPSMMVKWQNLGKEGNLNKRMGNNVITDINKARITVSLERGVPEELESVFPTLVGEQEKFYEELTSKCKEHMEVAFVQEEDHSWDQCKAGKEMEDFVDGANYSCLKSFKDENEDTVELVSMTRRVLDFQGNPNECIFWKSNEKGEYVQIEPRYIRKGSLIRCMGSLRSYNVNESMYGVSLDLERDIVVVWMPPVEDKTPQEKTKDPVIPFLNFEY